MVKGNVLNKTTKQRSNEGVKSSQVIIKSGVSSSKYSVIQVFSGLDDLYLCFPPPLLRLLFRSSGTVFMNSELDSPLPIFLEGFLYGKYPFCSLLCTLAKEVQLFLGLGIYSGILALYFQCQSNNLMLTGRTARAVIITSVVT